MRLGVHFGVRRDNAFIPRLGDVLAHKLAGADMLGRLQVLRHAYAKTKRRLPLSAAASGVQFDEDENGSATLGIGFDIGGENSSNYIAALTPVAKQTYDGLTAQYQRDAFTLAAASDARMVKKIQEALSEVAAKGGTAADFRAEVLKITDDAGVQQINAFTLDTAFNTAMQKAYSAGRLAQMKEEHMQAALPYWQYWTVGDDRVRPEHAVLDGFCARAIDPVWAKIYPPSGFNCRCSVVPVTADEAPEGSGEGGIERLPALARLLVPQPGFTTIFRAL